MARVLAINNYPTKERFVRLVRCFEDEGAEVTGVDWSKVSARRFGDFDGVVLSGSPDMMSEPRIQTKYSKETEAIVDSPVPVLGICFGHQMIAHAFGSAVVKDRQHVLGMVKTEALADDLLFKGLPRSMMLLESRYEVVKSVPDGFNRIARSATTYVAGIRHKTRPVYGLQGHIERYTEACPEGKSIAANFLRLLD